MGVHSFTSHDLIATSEQVHNFLNCFFIYIAAVVVGNLNYSLHTISKNEHMCGYQSQMVIFSPQGIHCTARIASGGDIPI